MSKDIDDLIKSMPPEKRAAFENTRADLKEQGAQVKPSNYDPQAPPRQAQYTNSNEPKLNKDLLPADQQAASPQGNSQEVDKMISDRSKAQTIDTGKELNQQQVKDPNKDQDQER